MDRVVAVVLFFTGLGVAWKSTELPIGFVPAEGPGGGFLPFWLSMGISAAAAGVFVQSFFGGTPGQQAEEGAEEKPFVTWEGFTGILRVGVPALIMILLTSTISIYFAAAAFVFYVLYYVGRHGLRTSLSVSVGVPIAIFFIFEKFLIIPLPKGYVEPLFYLEWGALF
ncbi:MAG: tripartite tricarboxylate transporter TctB family protein [bacterium]